MKKMKNIGILLVNLGTPDSPKTKDVRSYLFQFLNDKRVIDLPWLIRKILVNLIIVPFRAPKSAKIYKEVWTENGSPIIFHTESLKNKLSSSLGNGFHVEYAMRYKKPSIKNSLEKLRKKQPHQIIIVPLFPQYASATNGSVIEEVMKIIKNWWVIPEISFVSQFYDEKLFLDAFAEKGSKYNLKEYDEILFSFHGLPERHVDKVYEDNLCMDKNCEKGITDLNKFCYKATCYETAKQIALRLNLTEKDYIVAFQSRLDSKWLKPFSDDVIIKKGKKGKKKILVFSPSFVADCLETIIEIGDEYQEIFEEYGGEKVQLVESLNDSDLWVKCLKKIILDRKI
tara:strand:- start:1917 stop:2939 length:1023 start_codon:yes stop_codon:yes gene_type:complete